MFKSFFSRLFGGASAGSSASVAGSGDIARLQDFVTYIVKGLVEFPDDVNIDTVSQDDGTSIIQIRCRQSDIGKIVGKRGKIIMAIRSLVSGAAGRHHLRVSVNVLDN